MEFWLPEITIWESIVGPGAVFLKVPKLFEPISGRTIHLQLRNAEGLSHQTWQTSSLFFQTLKNVKNQLFKKSGLQFDNWLFGTEKFSELPGTVKTIPAFFHLLGS